VEIAIEEDKNVKLRRVELLMKLSTTGCHLPYGITRSHSVTCYPTQMNTPLLNTS